MDFVFIIAVLHHISNEQITGYLNEFSRVMKPEGTMIVIEPYLCPQHKLNNWFMKQYDNGEYIRSEDEYLQLFKRQQYEYQVIKRFRKGLLYNEIFFTAALKEKPMQKEAETFTSIPADLFAHVTEQPVAGQMLGEEALSPGTTN
ncbi:hypothetical protein D3C75_934430 [compost metagenome]